MWGRMIPFCKRWQTQGRVIVSVGDEMKLLSVSHDPVVLDARNQILRLNGYEVVASMNSTEAINFFRDQNFDGVILGDSIEAKERVALAREMLAAKPGVPIAFIRRFNDAVPEDLKVIIIENLDPRLLLAKLKASLGRSASAQ